MYAVGRAAFIDDPRAEFHFLFPSADANDSCLNWNCSDLKCKRIIIDKLW